MQAQYRYPTAFSSWGKEELAAIARVQESGRFTQGPEVEAFEAEFAAYHGMKHAIMVNSGSSANLIAVAAMASLRIIKPGDKALVPAIAWSTTYAPLVQHGLDLLVCDVDDGWNADVYARSFDPDEAKLIVACSILGNPAPLAALQNAAGILGDPLLEDNCESLGARTDDGRLCGTFGFLNTFSFFYSHQISAIEGGMILTNYEDAAQACRMLRAHGWTRDVWPEGQIRPFETEYDFHAFGYNVRGLEMHAAIGRAQLRKLDGFILERRNNLARFNEAAFDLITGAKIAMQWRDSSQGSPFGIAFEVEAGMEARRKVAHALRAAGIDCRLPTGGSFRRHPYGARWASQETPRADRVHDRGLFLGNAPYPIPDLIDEAADIIRRTLS